MPNLQFPGFAPAKKTSPGTIVYQRRMVASNNTTAIFLGDAVVPASSGGWVVASAANTAVGGVSTGASYVSNSVRTASNYLPAATTYSGTAIENENASYIFVAKGQDLVFRASCDEAIALTDLGINYQMVLGTGSTTTGRSGHELDATSRGTTATLPWRVEEFIVGDPLVDPSAADAHVFCRINRGLGDPALGDGTGT